MLCCKIISLYMLSFANAKPRSRLRSIWHNKNAIRKVRRFLYGLINMCSFYQDTGNRAHALFLIFPAAFVTVELCQNDPPVSPDSAMRLPPYPRTRSLPRPAAKRPPPPFSYSKSHRSSQAFQPDIFKSVPHGPNAPQPSRAVFQRPYITKKTPKGLSHLAGVARLDSHDLVARSCAALNVHRTFIHCRAVTNLDI